MAKRFFQIPFFLILCLFACKQNTNVPYKSNATLDPSIPLTKENFTGSWAPIIDRNVIAFKIDERSFYFNENGTFNPYNYEIKGDSFILKYPTYQYGYKAILWQGDSLHLMDDMQTSTFIRIKE